MGRPKGSESESEEFRIVLDDWFNKLANELRPSLVKEPEPLIRKREYKAAVISAMTLLESELKKRIKEDRLDRSRKFVSMNKAVDAAIKAEIISPKDASNIREWVFIRNQIVHHGESVTAKIAKTIIKEVTRIVQRLTNI